MRILAVADVESPWLWEHYQEGNLAGVDMILACGDLAPQYLSFLATFIHGPVIYVRGNHDDPYEHTPPEGCICAEDRIVVHEGVRILGLGGSMRYKEGQNQYTENEMRRRIRRMAYQLHRHRGFDILLTHAPARGFHDTDALPHRGFECFHPLLSRYQPSYFVHGHIHLNYGNYPRESQLMQTRVINAYEKCFFDI